jgi:hypothetical protein
MVETNEDILVFSHDFVGQKDAVQIMLLTKTRKLFMMHVVSLVTTKMRAGTFSLIQNIYTDITLA